MLAVAAAVLAMVGTVAAAPSDSDLEVVRIDPDAAPPGGLTTVHGFVANLGPEAAASPFTVEIDVPVGFTFEGPYFPAGCVRSAAGHVVRCTFGAGLPQGRTATALAPVRVNGNVPPGTKAEGHVRVFGLDDRHPGNNGTPFTLTVT